MSMPTLSLLGLGLLAVVLTLQGCGSAGPAPSPTPGPPRPAPTPGPPSPTPSTVTAYSYTNTTVGIGAGISLSGHSSATLSYDVSTSIVLGPALEKLFAEHRDAFTPDVAKLIEVVLDAAAKNFAGPAMSLMMTNLHAPLSNTSRDFLLALESSDSLARAVELKGQFTVKSSDSMIPRTYYPCIKVLQIDFMSGDTLTKSLMGLNAADIFTCSLVGTHQDKEHMSSPLIA